LEQTFPDFIREPATLSKSVQHPSEVWVVEDVSGRRGLSFGTIEGYGVYISRHDRPQKPKYMGGLGFHREALKSESASGADEIREWETPKAACGGGETGEGEWRGDGPTSHMKSLYGGSKVDFHALEMR